MWKVGFSRRLVYAFHVCDDFNVLMSFLCVSNTGNTIMIVGCTAIAISLYLVQ